MGKGENDSTDAQVFTGARRYLVDHQNGCIQSQQMLDDQTDTTPTHLLQNMNNKNKIRIYELWEKCQKFHAGLRHEIKKPDFRYNTSNTDHKWVALPPEQRYAVDKIPMSVVSGIYYTSDDNLWGPKMFTTRVWVTQAHSHSLSSASNGRDTARTYLCYFCGTGNIIFNVKKMVYSNNV